MSDATFPGGPIGIRLPVSETDPVTLPAPQPFGAPVLISDAITPLGGETVLSLLMKRMAPDGQ